MALRSSPEYYDSSVEGGQENQAQIEQETKMSTQERLGCISGEQDVLCRAISEGFSLKNPEDFFDNLSDLPLPRDDANMAYSEFQKEFEEYGKIGNSPRELLGDNLNRLRMRFVS